jgi:Ner family transcriptional regulator
MINSDTRKKPVAPGDWHPADIKAALEKRGYSMRRFARKCGYSPNSAAQVIFKAWPAFELLVAAELGLTPQVIWPSRYNEDGTPKRGRHTQFERFNRSTSKRRRNVSVASGA